MIQRWHDSKKGIEIRPTTFVNEATVSYQGMLVNDGATKLYIHYGFGDPYHWSATSTEEMNPTPRGTWEKTIRIKEDPCYFCFKDSAENWDNNNFRNWSIHYE